MALRPETPELIKFLNSLLEIDRPAIQTLLACRVRCSFELGEHPTLQVGCGNDGTVGAREEYSVGVLGLLNGWCGVVSEGLKEGWGPIVARYDEFDELAGFAMLPAAQAELNAQVA